MFRYNYIGYITLTVILTLINQHSDVYLCFTNIAFSDPNSAPIWPRLVPAAGAATVYME